MENTLYGTLVSPNTYRNMHEFLNVNLKYRVRTGNLYARQITDQDSKVSEVIAKNLIRQ